MRITRKKIEDYEEHKLLPEVAQVQEDGDNVSEEKQKKFEEYRNQLLQMADELEEREEEIKQQKKYFDEEMSHKEELLRRREMQLEDKENEIESLKNSLSKRETELVEKENKIENDKRLAKNHTNVLQDICIVGDIESNESLYIDGSINGSIKCKGDVLIAEGANIKADIIAQNVSVNGSVEGNIVAEQSLNIGSCGKVVGDVKIKSLSIVEEGILDGRCYMGKNNNSVEIEYQSSQSNEMPFEQEIKSLAKI